MPRAEVIRIVRAYDDALVRSYCWVRFGILRQRFLDEIGQYLPDGGRVLDVGCGFGLFSLYYAALRPSLQLLGVDRDRRRIDLARRAAVRLGIGNVAYAVGDAQALAVEEAVDAAYMLDIVHHLPRAAVAPLLAYLHASVRPGGRLLVKEVDTRPRYKRWFTHALDRLMDPRSAVCYWSSEDLARLLEGVGFRVFRHQMVDYLPYPHVLYVCERRG